ncbi:MAG TPA: tRNA (adenosine(37)-N6)-threonylcarbamoyltransferase complex dimerization subunit type 1 TsaB [Chthoniobacterales bacterium]|jgi:tRNA threonylcarbamoyladenosine biosynthesis protein TsaB
MKTLALELSSPRGSIAFRGAGEPVVRQFPADRQDSALFFENLRAIREECGLPDIIAVGVGPGSYAGIRIAIATALGLRAAANARVVGLPSICAFEPAEYFAIGDARRGSYFFAHVKEHRCLQGPSLVSEDELRATLGKSPHLPVLTSRPLAAFSSATLAWPSALILSELATDAPASNEPLEPIYLRAPYITTPKATPWTR